MPRGRKPVSKNTSDPNMKDYSDEKKKRGRKKSPKIELDPNMKDDTVERWTYYQQRYKAFNIVLDCIFPEGKEEKRNNGTFTYSNGINNVRKKDELLPGEINLCGDIAFNFGKDKIRAFKQSISGLTDETLNRLDSFYEMAIDNKNCTLMPASGSMNNVKGSIYFVGTKMRIAAPTYGRPDKSKLHDRLDSIISLLDDFYRKQNTTFTMKEALNYIGNSVFKHTMNNENYATLYDFLTSFESVYDYCKAFYGIDEGFVRELADNGRKPILTEDDLNRYMDLAERFWSIQEDIFNANTKQA